MRFLSILCTVGPLVLGGCAYLIPDNPSTPRYSTVTGERHAPQLNRAVGQAAVEQAAPVPVVDAVNVLPTDAFPPVDASTQATARQQLAVNNLPQPTGEVRQVPVENLQIAGNNVFDAVPPRPAMAGAAGSDADQLNKVREQLEQDRAAADAARDQLAKDAAAEPSLLNGTPGTVPPPAPVAEKPLAPLVTQPPALAPVPALPPAGLPPTSNVLPPQGGIAPAPAYLPPPPLMAAAPVSAPVPQPVAAAQPLPALEPIVLRPPVAATSLPSAATPAPRRAAPVEAAPSPLPAAGGSFNPMAAADSGYLPQSRYVR